ncbi:MAG: hypothetical protein SNJ76_04630 [Fimbriimonadaceae bacterium]
MSLGRPAVGIAFDVASAAVDEILATIDAVRDRESRPMSALDELGEMMIRLLSKMEHLVEEAPIPMFHIAARTARELPEHIAVVDAARLSGDWEAIHQAWNELELLAKDLQITLRQNGIGLEPRPVWLFWLRYLEPLWRSPGPRRGQS